jgi:mRNA interferase MazF
MEPGGYMDEKNFDEWNVLKKQLDKIDDPPEFYVGQIWFCSFGINIGQELNGKHKNSERPVVVFAKFGKTYCWAIPLTSGVKSGDYFYSGLFAGKMSSAVLIQMRLIDSRRLLRLIGRVSQKDLYMIRESVTALVYKK